MNIDAITPLIITYNEAPNISRVLERLRWAKRILVLDSHSKDQTEALCTAFANVEIYKRPFLSFEDQCNFGLTLIKTPWVLSIDADYVLDKTFPEELQTIPENTPFVAFYAHFRYCIWGKPLRNTLLPPRPVLFKIGTCTYYQDGHAHKLTINGESAYLTSKINHDDRKPLSLWFASQEKYATQEAKKMLLNPQPQGLPDRLRRSLYLAPIITPFYTLFAKGLILDGWAGWFYTLQRTYAEILLCLKLIEEKKNPDLHK